MLPPDLNCLLIDGVITQDDGTESSSGVRTGSLSWKKLFIHHTPWQDNPA